VIIPNLTSHLETSRGIFAIAGFTGEIAKLVEKLGAPG
jgi:hypothetical protein